MSLSSSYPMKALHPQEVRNIYIQRWGRKGMSASATLRQHLQQCLGFLEVCRVQLRKGNGCGTLRSEEGKDGATRTTLHVEE
jgi:hypothetical protein